MLSDFGSKNNNYENHKDFGNKKNRKAKTFRWEILYEFNYFNSNYSSRFLTATKAIADAITTAATATPARVSPV